MINKMLSLLPIIKSKDSTIEFLRDRLKKNSDEIDALRAELDEVNSRQADLGVRIVREKQVLKQKLQSIAEEI